MKKKRGAPRAKDTTKKVKKKTSVLVQERVEYVDYKDVNLLSRFMSDRSKIRARRVSGNDSQQQRDVATAIKNAREMALLPYTKRVTTQRGGRGEGRREREEVVERVAATEEVAGDEVEVVEEVTATEVEEG